MTGDEQGYQGWTNYATWGVKLVLDNEEETYNAVRAQLAQIRRDAPKHSAVVEKIWTEEQGVVYLFEEWLKDYTERLCGLEDDKGPSLMARQVIQAGLSEVNWREIAENIASES